MLLENPIYTNLKTFFVLSCGFLVLAERLFREPQIAITNSLSNASGGLAIGIVAGTIYNVTEKYSPKTASALRFAVAVLPTLVLTGHEIFGYSILGIGNGGDGISEVIPLILCVAAGLYATSRKNFSQIGE